MALSNQLAKIHIAKKQLGLDDDTYRAMLRQHGGVNSAKDLSPVGAAKVLAHLERAGFKPTNPVRHGKRPAPRPSREALVSKIEAQLADAGRPWDYVDAMAKRMFKVDRLAWLDEVQLGKIVAALAYDAKRRAGAGAAPKGRARG